MSLFLAVFFSFGINGAEVPVSRWDDFEVLVEGDAVQGDWSVVDVDDDSDPDLILPHRSGGFQVWLQSDAQAFSPLEGDRITENGRLDAWGDVDGDGDLDVWVFGRFGGVTSSVRASLWLNRGDGQFFRSDQAIVVDSPIRLGDMDRDGDLDVVSIKHSLPMKNIAKIWHNDGNGRFTLDSEWELITDMDRLELELGDLNGDGWTDLIFASRFEGGIAWNREGERFEMSDQVFEFEAEPITIGWTTDLLVEDIDDDQDLDVLLTSELFSNGLWLNDGRGNFSHQTAFLGGSGLSIATGDVDLDGDADVMIHHHNGDYVVDPFNRIILYTSEGDGRMKTDYAFSATGRYNEPELVDLDGDSDLDLLTRRGNTWGVYRNEIHMRQRIEDSGVVEIPDEALRQAVLEDLGKNSGNPVTQADMTNIRYLDLSHKMKGWGIPIIADFSGLEFAAMLEILDVSGRVPDPVFGATFPVFETTDLSFLNSLSELRILKLAYNHMDSFEWVSGLENLQELDLRDTGLTHFGLSKELPKLDVLDLRQNPIRSLQLPDSMVDKVSLNQGHFLAGTLMVDVNEGVGIQMRFFGSGTYEVQRTIDFQTWEPVQRFRNVQAGDVKDFSDIETGGLHSFFYRIVSVP
jgi:hypothetical protein